MRGACLPIPKPTDVSGRITVRIFSFLGSFSGRVFAVRELAGYSSVERGVEDVSRAVSRKLADLLAAIARLETRVRAASGDSATVTETAEGATIKKLSADDVRDRLYQFERAYAAATGEALSSARFYERFTAGEFDNRFGLRWACFYEASQLRQESDRLHATA
jgi:hypothetical protein